MDSFGFDFEDVVKDVAAGDVTSLVGNGPSWEDGVDRRDKCMCEYFCISVGSREWACLVGRTRSTSWVAEVGFWEKPQEGIVKTFWEGIAVDPKKITVV